MWCTRGFLVVGMAVVGLGGCASSHGEPPAAGDGGGPPGVFDAAPPPPPPFIDAGNSFTCDPVDGPAAHLLIDDSVHVGGVWNEPMDFHMDQYPLGWAIATVHASMLLRSRCINLSPNAVLSMALKESRLTCGVPGSLANGDGCFQIESTTAYVELQRMFPGRFTATFADVIANDHFETSAIAMAHYMLFSTAMFRKYSSCPEKFAIDHPDPHTAQKVLLGAYNRGLWWNALPNIFTHCNDRDVVECFEPGVAVDYVHAIVDYTVGLEPAPVFDAPLRWQDVLAYWQRLRPLYPDADDAAVTSALRAGFDTLRGNAETISFRDHIRCLLRVLIDALPPMATVEDAVAAACGQSYLMGTACQPGGGCPPDLRCRDDGPVIQ
jgi:hypothetical protein